MGHIIIMGLSGDSKVLPMTATKTEIVDTILKTATKCADCSVVINWDEDGGHIYPDGQTLCADCEAN